MTYINNKEVTYKYKPNEPIFLAELDIHGMKPVSVRQQMKKLMEEGRLKRFDAEIYYIPKKSMFRSSSTLAVDEVRLFEKNTCRTVSTAVVILEGSSSQTSLA